MYTYYLSIIQYRFLTSVQQHSLTISLLIQAYDISWQTIIVTYVTYGKYKLNSLYNFNSTQIGNISLDMFAHDLLETGDTEDKLHRMNQICALYGLKISLSKIKATALHGKTASEI